MSQQLWGARAIRGYGVAVVSVVVLLLVATSSSSDTPSATQSAADDVPRTAWGDPDLQGNWTNKTLTPFQRPEGQGAILTPQQAADLEAGRAAVEEELIEQTSDPNRAAPEVGGVDDPICIEAQCYNEVYTDRGDQIAIIDGQPRSSIVTIPADGRVPALTPAGRDRVVRLRASREAFGEFDHPELRPLAERCIVSFGSSAGPPMLPNYWYNNNYTIVQNADHVMIMAEMVHDTRIIRLGDPKPLPGDVRPYFGDSWGHWEGNTLVVETTNLNPDHAFRGIPPSEDMKVTERFTRVDDETFLYEFTIDDPATYSESWGGQLPFKKFDQMLYEYACHEGNYALYNVLSGARYQERQEGGSR